jgi:hypothetical protein
MFEIVRPPVAPHATQGALVGSSAGYSQLKKAVRKFLRSLPWQFHGPRTEFGALKGFLMARDGVSQDFLLLKLKEYLPVPTLAEGLFESLVESGVLARSQTVKAARADLAHWIEGGIQGDQYFFATAQGPVAIPEPLALLYLELPRSADRDTLLAAARDAAGELITSQDMGAAVNRSLSLYLAKGLLVPEGCELASSAFDPRPRLYVEARSRTQEELVALGELFAAQVYEPLVAAMMPVPLSAGEADSQGAYLNQLRHLGCDQLGATYRAQAPMPATAWAGASPQGATARSLLIRIGDEPGIESLRAAAGHALALDSQLNALLVADSIQPSAFVRLGEELLSMGGPARLIIQSQSVLDSLSRSAEVLESPAAGWLLDNWIACRNCQGTRTITVGSDRAQDKAGCPVHGAWTPVDADLGELVHAPRLNAVSPFCT